MMVFEPLQHIGVKTKRHRFLDGTVKLAALKPREIPNLRDVEKIDIFYNFSEGFSFYGKAHPKPRLTISMDNPQK